MNWRVHECRNKITEYLDIRFLWMLPKKALLFIRLDVDLKCDVFIVVHDDLLIFFRTDASFHLE